MKWTVVICTGLVLCLVALESRAYEPDTHSKLSDEAALNSVLNTTIATPNINTTVLKDINLAVFSQNIFPDIESGESVNAGPGAYFAPQFTAQESLTDKQLIEAGAELEDRGNRPFCHFYDPVVGHTAPLNFAYFNRPYSANYTAQDWVTATAGSICTLSGPLATFSSDAQNYSLSSADTYFYQALTMPNESDRDQNFGELFLSIGHELHLLEDMAQPQHVRNDMHCDSLKCLPFGLYHPNEYEKYAYINYDEVQPDYSKTPDLPTAEDYWSTGDQRGLAEYTNMNFVSVGTTYSLTGTGGGSNYTMPAANGSVPVSVGNVFGYIGTAVPNQIANYCQTRNCSMTFVTSDVHDQYAGTDATNSWAAAYSIFNADLNDVNGHQFYTLDAATEKSAEDFLLAQAKSYGAGLINHFFRGRLDVQPDPNNAAGSIVINKSSYPMSNGTLGIYYDSTDGTRHLLESWSSVSIPAAGGSSPNQYPVQFSPPR